MPDCTTILLMGYMISLVRYGITSERHKEKNNVLSFQVINFQRHIADTRGVTYTILQKDLKLQMTSYCVQEVLGILSLKRRFPMK